MDVASFSRLRAGKIYLVSDSSDLGVRVKGGLIAHSGDLSLDIKGDLKVGGESASKSSSGRYNCNGDKVSEGASLFSCGGNVSVLANNVSNYDIISARNNIVFDLSR